METNVTNLEQPEGHISRLLALIGQPARVQILLVLAHEEACVCHLETVTGMRQAGISQHLMALRKAGLVAPHRSGRNVFYRLERPEIISILQQAAALAGVTPAKLADLARRPVCGCPCPQCNPGKGPNFAC